MSERVKERREVVYFYDDLENLVKEVETRIEPLDTVAAPEFTGVVGTLSLPHGSVPPDDTVGGYWDIYKVYEKVVIWLHHQGKKEPEKVG